MCVHSLSCTHTHKAQWDALRSIPYVHSLPGKWKVAVAGRLTAPDRYRTAFTAVCGRLLSTVLFYPSLSSVHLLFICSAVLVQYILYHLCFPPITNSQLRFARSSTVCLLILSSYCLSSVIRQPICELGEQIWWKHVIYKGNQIYIRTLRAQTYRRALKRCNAAQTHAWQNLARKRCTLLCFHHFQRTSVNTAHRNSTLPNRNLTLHKGLGLGISS